MPPERICETLAGPRAGEEESMTRWPGLARVLVCTTLSKLSYGAIGVCTRYDTPTTFYEHL